MGTKNPHISNFLKTVTREPNNTRYYFQRRKWIYH